MKEELSLAEKRKLSNDITNTINKWAADRFDASRAYVITTYLRALAKNAVCFTSRPSSLIKDREEAKVIMEAAEDLMEMIDSIRYKAKHKGE